MKKVVFMIGIPRSGKSTFIEKNFLGKGFQIVCRDDVRLALGTRYNSRIESTVTMVTNTMFKAFMERGLDVVIDQTNCNGKHLIGMVKVADLFGYMTQAIVIDVPIETCIKRSEETTKVPVDVIYRMYNNFLDLTCPGVLTDLFDSVQIRQRF